MATRGITELHDESKFLVYMPLYDEAARGTADPVAVIAQLLDVLARHSRGKRRPADEEGQGLVQHLSRDRSSLSSGSAQPRLAKALGQQLSNLHF